MVEKTTVEAAADSHPGSTHPPARPTSLTWSNLRSAAAVSALAIYVLALIVPKLSDENACPQPAIKTPASLFYAPADTLWKTAGFQDRAVDWLSGAIQVETESYDGMGDVGIDARWEKFAGFHAYLERSFPRTHASLTLTKVNTHGLVFEWTGADPSLKPILFAAHQDVVPVEQSTLHEWVQPPYSGHYDGDFIWGRGAIDDKSSLIGVMSAVESLLEVGYMPRRTVVLAFGFDEEVYGFRGAGTIAPFLLNKYGRHGFGLLVDEGGGFVHALGKTVAAFGTAEKGGGNARITVKATGGHASSPHGRHTSIGFLSLLIAHLETHPHPPTLTRDNPIYSALVCGAKHVDLPWHAKALVKGSLASDWLLSALTYRLTGHNVIGALIGTTQAVTVSSGGVKVNALPETATAIVHHRIGASSSGAAVREHITELVTAKAKELNLTLTAFGEDVISAPGVGQIIVEEAFGDWFEPAPVTPTTPDTPAWQLMAGSIRSTFATRIKHTAAEAAKGNEIIVTPALGPWNTDTRHYWDLTTAIFRYNHISLDDMYSMTSLHSVNEAFRATGFVESIRAFGIIILNADEHDL